MFVVEWCQVNDITKANYYYRFAKVRKACLDTIPIDTIDHTIVPVPMELMQAEPESQATNSNGSLTENYFLKITAHGATIRVTEQTLESLFKKVIGGTCSC